MTLAPVLEEMLQNKHEGICPFCGNLTDHVPFRDELSEEEARISGLCQFCQDDFFGDEAE